MIHNWQIRIWQSTFCMKAVVVNLHYLLDRMWNYLGHVYLGMSEGISREKLSKRG